MLLALLILLPAASGTVLLLAGRRADRAAAPIAVAAAAVTLLLGLAAAVLRPTTGFAALPALPVQVAVDGLAAVAVVTVGVVLLAVLVFASAEIGRGEARARFHGLMLLFAAAMLVTVTATGILPLLAGWEVMGATSYALIGYWWRESDRVQSATVAFLTTRGADLGMYVAAGAALAGGGLTLADLVRLAPGWREVALGGLALAALGKSAQLPFSFWLARAMAGPSAVSALLHSTTMVAAGAYLLLRLNPALPAAPVVAGTVAWVGALTALALGAVALVQRDLKQLLAASTASQIGFIVLAAAVPGGAAAGAAQFSAHAAVKSLLFLVAGAWLTVLGTRDLARLSGAARANPVVGITATVGLLALGGVPPLSIWFAKDAILAAVLPASPALAVVGLAAAALSAAYAGRALGILWGSETGARPARFPRRLLLPLPVLAAAAAVLGVVVIPPLSHAWQRLVPGSAGPSAGMAAVSAALAVVVAAAAWFLQARRSAGDPLGPAILRDWLGLEPLAKATIVRPVLAVAASLARFDDAVLARAVTGLGGTGLAVAASASRVEGRLEATVAVLAAAFRRLGSLARRPQTGLVHQYYAQAALAVGVLTLILLAVS